MLLDEITTTLAQIMQPQLASAIINWKIDLQI